jgi:hypothetical protein
MRVLRPATEDEVRAAYDRAALGSTRDHHGWRTTPLFDGFPDVLDWAVVALTPDEVLAIRYINWDWWLTLSGGTRRPQDAAARIRSGRDATDIEWHRPIAAALSSPEPPPELIAVTDLDRSQLVLVEGHVRLTAYAVFPEYLPAELEILLGSSSEIGRWSEF